MEEKYVVEDFWSKSEIQNILGDISNESVSNLISIYESPIRAQRSQYGSLEPSCHMSNVGESSLKGMCGDVGELGLFGEAEEGDIIDMMGVMEGDYKGEKYTKECMQKLDAAFLEFRANSLKELRALQQNDIQPITTDTSADIHSFAYHCQIQTLNQKLAVALNNNNRVLLHHNQIALSLGKEKRKTYFRGLKAKCFRYWNSYIMHHKIYNQVGIYIYIYIHIHINILILSLNMLIPIYIYIYLDIEINGDDI